MILHVEERNILAPKQSPPFWRRITERKLRRYWGKWLEILGGRLERLGEKLAATVLAWSALLGRWAALVCAIHARVEDGRLLLVVLWHGVLVWLWRRRHELLCLLLLVWLWYHGLLLTNSAGFGHCVLRSSLVLRRRVFAWHDVNQEVEHVTLR